MRGIFANSAGDPYFEGEGPGEVVILNNDPDEGENADDIATGVIIGDELSL